MRNLIYISCLFLFSCTAQKPVYMFTSFHEPATEGLRFLYSYDGYNWKDVNGTFLKPEVGSKVMRDPSIARGPDGVYHLVWTSGWNKDRGFGYASSKDLKHWSQEEFIPVMQHEDSVVNVWAPEIFYDDVDDQFIIVWASTIPWKFEKGQEDEHNNHRLYYTVTKDFKNFSKAELFLDPKFSVIDAEIVKRGANDYVLVLKDNTRPMRNIKVAFSTRALGPYTGVSAPFTDNYTEGPSVAKVGNEYLIYFDAYRTKTYEAVTTTDFKTFSKADVSVPKGHKHGTIFMSTKKVLKGLLAGYPPAAPNGAKTNASR
jgi:hypothetical protein